MCPLSASISISAVLRRNRRGRSPSRGEPAPSDSLSSHGRFEVPRHRRAALSRAITPNEKAGDTDHESEMTGKLSPRTAEGWLIAALLLTLPRGHPVRKHADAVRGPSLPAIRIRRGT